MFRQNIKKKNVSLGGIFNPTFFGFNLFILSSNKLPALPPFLIAPQLQITKGKALVAIHSLLSIGISQSLAKVGGFVAIVTRSDFHLNEDQLTICLPFLFAIFKSNKIS